MSVRACTYPWHWLLITHSGDCLPCSHGAGSVGNVREQSLEEIWNGPRIREIRSAILAGEVHPLCRTTECPFQHHHPAFPRPKRPPHVDEAFARAFDEEDYLASHPDVRLAVLRGELGSGLEHFIRHGCADGYGYRLRSHVIRRDTPLANPVQAMLDYSERRVTLRAVPAVVVLAVTTVCNLRCVMCPQGMGLVTQPTHMPADIVEHAAAWLRTTSRLLLSGVGEPMLAPAFWRALELTRGRTDLWSRVNTNGLLLTPERTAAVLDSGLSEISFSLDAATPGTYARIRGARLDDVLVHIAAFSAARRRSGNRRLDVSVNMTLMLENIGEAPALVDLAHKLGLDSVLFSQLHNFGDRPDWVVTRDSWRFTYAEQRLTLAPDLARHHLDEACARARAHGLRVDFHGNVQTYLTKSQLSAPSVQGLPSTF